MTDFGQHRAFQFGKRFNHRLAHSY
jgi:hypothetical protein